MDQRGPLIAQVEANELKLVLGGRTVLAGLNLTVETGTICAIVGESGSGKSSLLRAIAGFLDPDGGSISLDGVDQAGIAPADRPVVLLFQDARLFPALNVRDNVSFGLRVQGVAATERDAAAMSLLERVGLADRATDPIDGLSGGEQQRVSLARALCVEPQILLLDEPFSAVDAPRRRELRSLISNLHAEQKHTMIFVTHDIADATALADTVAVLVDGVVAQHGPVAEVVAAPVTPAVAALLGADPA